MSDRGKIATTSLISISFFSSESKATICPSKLSASLTNPPLRKAIVCKTSSEIFIFSALVIFFNLLTISLAGIFLKSNL